MFMSSLRWSFVAAAVVTGSVLGASVAKADGPAYGRSAGPCCAPSWTGFYLGGGVGYGTFVTSQTTVNTGTGIPDRPFVDFGGQGWFGTAIVGYDQQIGNVVLGAFADFDWSGASGRVNDLLAMGTTFGRLDEDTAWAIGARAGFLATAKTLVYLSGGYTQVRFDGFQLE